MGLIDSYLGSLSSGDKVTEGSPLLPNQSGGGTPSWVTPAILATLNLAGGLFGSNAQIDAEKRNRQAQLAYLQKQADLQKQRDLLERSFQTEDNLANSLVSANSIESSGRNSYISQLNNLASLIQNGYLRGGR